MYAILSVKHDLCNSRHRTYVVMPFEQGDVEVSDNCMSSHCGAHLDMVANKYCPLTSFGKRYQGLGLSLLRSLVNQNNVELFMTQ